MIGGGWVVVGVCACMCGLANNYACFGLANLAIKYVIFLARTSS